MSNKNKYSQKNKQDKEMKRNKSKKTLELQNEQLQASDKLLSMFSRDGAITRQKRQQQARLAQQQLAEMRAQQRRQREQYQQQQARGGGQLDRSFVQKLNIPTRIPTQAIGRTMQVLQQGKNFKQKLAAARTREDQQQLIRLFEKQDKAGKEVYKAVQSLMGKIGQDFTDKKLANARDKFVNSAQLFSTVLGIPKTDDQYLSGMVTLGDMFINRNRTILQTTTKKKQYIQRLIRSLLADASIVMPPNVGIELRTILNAMLTQKMAVTKLSASNPLNIGGVQYVPLQKKLAKAVDGLPGFGLDSRDYIFFDKYRYNQETKPTEQQLKQFAAAKSTLQLPASHLESYPQWLITRSAQIQQSKKLSKESMKAVLQNENNSAMSSLAKIDSKLAYFNTTKQQWQGSASNILKSKLKNPQQFAKKYGQSNYLLQQKLTADQVTMQIPPVIKDIVQANDSISKYGFGPVKPDGVGLYAGRWLDTVTGNLRVLPNASSKFLNPLDVNQKLGYLQARILNHWNNLINSAQQYNNLLINKDKYGQKVKNQLQNSLNPAKVKQLNSKIIDRTIDQYMIYKIFDQNQIEGGSNMNKYKAIILNRVQPAQLSEVRKQSIQKVKVTLWTRLVSRAYDTLQSDVNRVAGKNINAQVSLQSKLSAAYLSLVDTSIRKVKGALKKIMMIKTVPAKITQQNALQTVEAVNQGNQFLNEKLDPLTLDPSGVRSFMDSIRSTFLGKTEKQISQSLTVPAALNKSTIGQFQAWGPQSQLFKGADVNPWYSRLQTAKLSRNQTKNIQSELFELSGNSMGRVQGQERWQPRISGFVMQKPQKPYQSLSQRLGQSRNAIVEVLTGQKA